MSTCSSRTRRRDLGLRRGVLRTGAGIPARRRSRHRRRHRAEDGKLEEHHAQPARREHRRSMASAFPRSAGLSCSRSCRRVWLLSVSTPHYDTADPFARPIDGYDLIVAADGLNSLVRRSFEGDFGVSVVLLQPTNSPGTAPTNASRRCRRLLSKTARGAFNAHHYRYAPDMSTFLVECDRATWQHYGFAYKDAEQSQSDLRGACLPPTLDGGIADLQQIGLAEFSVDLERALVVQEYGADRRRAAFRALLDRLGNAAGDRGRHCAGKVAGGGSAYYGRTRALRG